MITFKKNFLVFILILFAACNANNASIAVATKKEKPLVIFQPINNFPSAILKFLKDSVEKFYPVKVEINAPKTFPINAYYKPRNRFGADSIINWLPKIKPEHARTIIALTNDDISETKGSTEDYGIMGLGFQPGAACVVSDFRLHANNPSEKQLRERIFKTVIHELGHNFGLPHCADTNCIMADKKGKLTQDKENGLCENCRRKVRI